MSTPVQVFMWTYVSISLGLLSRSRVAGLLVLLAHDLKHPEWLLKHLHYFTFLLALWVSSSFVISCPFAYIALSGYEAVSKSGLSVFNKICSSEVCLVQFHNFVLFQAINASLFLCEYLVHQSTKAIHSTFLLLVSGLFLTCYSDKEHKKNIIILVSLCTEQALIKEELKNRSSGWRYMHILELENIKCHPPQQNVSGSILSNLVINPLSMPKTICLNLPFPVQCEDAWGTFCLGVFQVAQQKAT